MSVEDVLEVLKPIWVAKPETASRLRGRIERVLDAAKAQGLRFGENPARWRGHLDQLLPKRQRLTRGHHAAMAYPDVPAFIGDLRAREAVAARALEFAILTAARSGEVLNARWAEIDFERGVWTVPANRMKAGRDPSLKKPLSEMALAMVLRRMKIEGATVHGFRSSFRDWSAEYTSFSNETCEAGLAHVVDNKAEAAYRRGDQFEKRRKLNGRLGVLLRDPGGRQSRAVRRQDDRLIAALRVRHGWCWGHRLRRIARVRYRIP